MNTAESLARTDPVTYIPSDLDASVETTDIAREVLAEMHPSVEHQHFRRSALAGSAVYVASLVTIGAGRVSQPAAADATGSTEKSVRRHMTTVARAALTNERVTSRESVDVAVLQRLADGERVTELLTG